ncbi:MAG: hypothetical protein PHD43_06835 [Methylococcales bacterium]|nr:hypothetical protein [Methylococcales bacterium]
MNASVTTKNRLLIRRFQAQYQISRDHPAPERIQSRLDEAVTRGLAQTLAHALTPWFSKSDASIWLIRQLDVELAVNANLDEELLKRTWAAQIARSTAVSVQGGSDGENVMGFASRAAYLARFLADLAQGRAWGKWYYEGFEGLRPLPVSAALRTTVCEQPATGREALRLLQPFELDHLLRALSAQDARRVLDSFAETDASSDDFDCFQTVWSIWTFQVGEDWSNALRLYLDANKENVGGLPLRAAALALLRLHRRLSNGKSSLVTILTNGDIAALYESVGASDAEMLAPLLRCPPEWVQEVSGQLLAQNTGSVAAETVASPGPRQTNFGGLFLLLPLIDELPLEVATHDWPDTEDVSGVTLARFLLLIKSCGQPRAHSVFHDFLLRDLLGIPPAFSMDALADWQKGVSASHLQDFLKTLETWLAERGTIHGETLILTLASSSALSQGQGPPAILIDAARGVWLSVTDYSARNPKRPLGSLGHFFSGERLENATLLCDPALLDSLHSAFPDRQMLSLDDPAVGILVDEDDALADILARLDKLPDDFDYLSLPKSWRISSTFDRALSVGAQGLLRSFAWRLPGFAGSNLPYLYSNFLDFAGSMEEETARRVVRLGRPPLHLILNMTGMERKIYTLSWLGERPFTLFPEG